MVQLKTRREAEDSSKLVSDRDYRKLERLVKANSRDFRSNITSKFYENI